TVDQLVILTVPSGAEITLGSKQYGNSPVKLEKVPIGTYTLSITKEGFETKVEQITVAAESGPLEYRLKPVPPSDAAESAPEEQIKIYQQGANEAFAAGHYAIPFDTSALSYVESILSIDGTNQFASEMRERIRKAKHQNAQASMPEGTSGARRRSIRFLGNTTPATRRQKPRLPGWRTSCQLVAVKCAIL